MTEKLHFIDCNFSDSQLITSTYNKHDAEIRLFRV